jgi:PBP1b-binding outer membrane lipoprotein LpoB
MKTIRALTLLLASASLLAGCSQGPAASEADLQEKLTAAEARANAAEKRAKAAEMAAQQHAQEPPARTNLAPPPEVAEGGGDFGQPMNDTRPIDPVPAVNPDAHP